MDKQTSAKPLTDDRLAAIVARLAENTAGLRYGTVTVSLRIHDGRVVEVMHTVTENQREHPGP